jgi:hypothetical protein
MAARFVEIPRWLYENDLPDAQLQAIYVEEAEKKLRELAARRRALVKQLAAAQAVEAEARAFLADARAALARYAAAAANREPQHPPGSPPEHVFGRGGPPPLVRGRVVFVETTSASPATRATVQEVGPPETATPRRALPWPR